ncbi:MAG: L-lactate permease [Candidatus Thermoplasmatota archaeon]|nr:L-lactate permease [Candidatus Thermoplasmatota archaeon]
MLTIALILAVLPIFMVILLLLLRIPPHIISSVALAIGVLELFYFHTPLVVVLYSEESALFTAAEVAMIILGGILLYEIIKACTIDQTLAEWFATLSKDPTRLALLTVLGITPFMESVTGFGVGAIFAIPLLQRMGFKPEKAAILGLLGYVAVPWGALGPGTLVAARITGISFQTLGVVSAFISLPLFLIAGCSALIIAGGLKALKRLDELVILSFSLWGGILITNIVFGTPLAGVFGSMVSIATGVAIILIREKRRIPYSRELIRITSPYGILVVLLLTSRLVYYGTTLFHPGLLTGATIVSVVLESPATWLLATSLITVILLKQKKEVLVQAGRNAITRWWRVAFTTFCFLALGYLMVASGMTGIIAGNLTQLGRGYLLMVPFIGALGGLLTGSNTGANAMFAQQQAEAASGIGYSKLWVVGIQNVSASLFTMASGPRIQLAMSLFDGKDKDISVFRTVFLIDVMVALTMIIVLFLRT